MNGGSKRWNRWSRSTSGWAISGKWWQGMIACLQHTYLILLNMDNVDNLFCQRASIGPFSSFYFNSDTSSCWPTLSLLWQEITARSLSTLSWTTSQPPSRSNQSSASYHFGLIHPYLTDGAAAELLWNDAGRLEGRKEREAVVQDDDQTWQTLLRQVAT